MLLPMGGDARRLILWDIDGTLLYVKGAGRRAFEVAMERLHARETEWGDIHFGGVTDLWVVERLFELNAIEDGETARADFLSAYFTAYEELSEDAERALFPGVVEALEAIEARTDWVQGLITGNAQESAWSKLRFFGLERFFCFGAFGDDHADRCALARLAVERAQHETGQRFEPWQVVVIGDTVNDVNCGRHIGAMTIAVETGRHSLDSLEGVEPDLRLPDLSDTAGLINAIQGFRPVESR